MNNNCDELRTTVRDLLLDLDQSISPGDLLARDAGRHACRLRFALDRVEALTHTVATESPTITAARLEVAEEILRFDIDRTRHFLRGARSAPLGTRPMQVLAESAESDITRRAA